MSWFGRRPLESDPVERIDSLEAYKEGRLDERRVDPAADPRAAKAEVDAAYDRGRMEGRRRRGFPILGLAVLLVFIFGALMLYLTISRGSVSKGGAAVDQSISTVAQKAQAPLRGAADKAGNALENAGTDLKQRAGSDKP